MRQHPPLGTDLPTLPQTWSPVLTGASITLVAGAIVRRQAWRQPTGSTNNFDINAFRAQA